MELFIFARFHARPGHASAVEKALRDVIGPSGEEPRMLERSPAVLHPLAVEGRGRVRASP
jgi:quinol monooxygenase YgiN